MHKVLVTGASGFVGGHVVRALLSRGIAVRCLVRKASRLDYLKHLNPEPALGDVTQPETLKGALDGIDSVVHCAGITKAPSRREFFRVNEGGCRHLYSACKEARRGIVSVVHISSLAALGPSTDGKPITEDCPAHPVSDYGESKLAGQRVAESCMGDLPISVIVPPAVYGPRDVDFLIYFKLVARRIMPLLGTGDRHLSLVYVKDLAEAVAQALLSEKAHGKSYLVEDGSVQTWASVANTIGLAMNRTPRQVHLPVSAVKVLGVLGDLYARLTGKASLITSQKVREFLQVSWTCSSRRIREELGFCPRYPLESGIRETLAWYRENRWL